MNTPYCPPVNKLLTLGKPKESGEWINYREMGLEHEHIPELIRMATDEALNQAEVNSREVWAPLHAWRALGQLNAKEAAEPLVQLFHKLEDDDWSGEELPVVFGMIGPGAIPTLEKYLADSSHDLFPRVTAARSLEQVGNTHPEAREECVSVLMHQLERFAENGEELNAFIISNLVDLKAVEALPVIQEAFEKNCVDFTIQGDLEDVEIQLGLRKTRSTPANYPTVRDKLLSRLPEIRDLLAQAAKLEKRKIGRNDPCPCGSGKKYKKCCLNKATDK